MSLIHSKTSLFPNIKEALQLITESPVYAVQASDPSNVITLEQKFTPFPGETFILRGSFKRDVSALIKSAPVSESFTLEYFSKQQGFPDPFQNNGFATTSLLIPPYPMRPDELPAITRFIDQKEQHFAKMKQKGALANNCRNLWKTKIDLFETRKKNFLSLHLRLAESIAAHRHSSEKSDRIIQDFFKELSLHESCLFRLASVYREINERFCEAPCRNFQKAWTSNPQTFIQREPEERLEMGLAMMTKTLGCIEIEAFCDFTPKEVAFIRLMGPELGKSIARIFFQYFSEILECPPPELTSFDRALQTAAFIQLTRFIKETALVDGYDCLAMEKTLIEDTEIFLGNIPIHPFCSLLEGYYFDRFNKNQ